MSLLDLRLVAGLVLLASPAIAADPAELQRLSELVTIQAEVYGALDRCQDRKIPELELRELVKKIQAAGASPEMVALVKTSYVNGIKAAANINCELAPAILQDLAARHAKLTAPSPQPPK